MPPIVGRDSFRDTDICFFEGLKFIFIIHISGWNEFFSIYRFRDRWIISDMMIIFEIFDFFNHNNNLFLLYIFFYF